MIKHKRPHNQSTQLQTLIHNHKVLSNVHNGCCSFRRYNSVVNWSRRGLTFLPEWKHLRIGVSCWYVSASLLWYGPEVWSVILILENSHNISCSAISNGCETNIFVAVELSLLVNVQIWHKMEIVDEAEVCCFCSVKSLASAFPPWSFQTVTRVHTLPRPGICLCVSVEILLQRSWFSLVVSVWKSKGEVTLFFTVILTSTETCLAQFREPGQGQTLQGRWVLSIEIEYRSKTCSFANLVLFINLDWEVGVVR